MQKGQSGQMLVLRRGHRLHDALNLSIPMLTIRTTGADGSQVAATLDGQPVPSVLIGEKQPIDPGAHHIEGAVGAQHVHSDFTIAIGESAVAVLRFDANLVAAETKKTAPAPTRLPLLTASAFSARPNGRGSAIAASRMPHSAKTFVGAPTARRAQRQGLQARSLAKANGPNTECLGRLQSEEARA